MYKFSAHNHFIFQTRAMKRPDDDVIAFVNNNLARDVGRLQEISQTDQQEEDEGFEGN